MRIKILAWMLTNEARKHDAVLRCCGHNWSDHETMEYAGLNDEGVTICLHSYISHSMAGRTCTCKTEGVLESLTFLQLPYATQGKIVKELYEALMHFIEHGTEYP